MSHRQLAWTLPTVALLWSAGAGAQPDVLVRPDRSWVESTVEVEIACARPAECEGQPAWLSIPAHVRHDEEARYAEQEDTLPLDITTPAPLRAWIALPEWEDEQVTLRWQVGVGAGSMAPRGATFTWDVIAPGEDPPPARERWRGDDYGDWGEGFGGWLLPPREPPGPWWLGALGLGAVLLLALGRRGRRTSRALGPFGPRWAPLALALALLPAGPGGCGGEPEPELIQVEGLPRAAEVRFDHGGKGPQNEAPLLPLRLGAVHGLGSDVLGEANPADTVPAPPAGPPTVTLESWRDGEAEHFFYRSVDRGPVHLVRTEAGIFLAGVGTAMPLPRPILLLPARVRPGMRWTSYAPLMDAETFDEPRGSQREENPRGPLAREVVFDAPRSQAWRFVVRASFEKETSEGRRRVWVVDVRGPDLMNVEPARRRIDEPEDAPGSGRLRLTRWVFVEGAWPERFDLSLFDPRNELEALLLANGPMNLPDPRKATAYERGYCPLQEWCAPALPPADWGRVVPDPEADLPEARLVGEVEGVSPWRPFVGGDLSAIEQADGSVRIRLDGLGVRGTEGTRERPPMINHDAMSGCFALSPDGRLADWVEIADGHDMFDRFCPHAASSVVQPDGAVIEAPFGFFGTGPMVLARSDEYGGLLAMRSMASAVVRLPDDVTSETLEEVYQAAARRGGTMPIAAWSHSRSGTEGGGSYDVAPLLIPHRDGSLSVLRRWVDGSNHSDFDFVNPPTGWAGVWLMTARVYVGAGDTLGLAQLLVRPGSEEPLAERTLRTYVGGLSVRADREGKELLWIRGDGYVEEQLVEPDGLFVRPLFRVPMPEGHRPVGIVRLSARRYLLVTRHGIEHLPDRYFYPVMSAWRNGVTTSALGETHFYVVEAPEATPPPARPFLPGVVAPPVSARLAGPFYELCVRASASPEGFDPAAWSIDGQPVRQVLAHRPGCALVRTYGTVPHCLALLRGPGPGGQPLTLRPLCNVREVQRSELVGRQGAHLVCSHETATAPTGLEEGFPVELPPLPPSGRPMEQLQCEFGRHQVTLFPDLDLVAVATGSVGTKAFAALLVREADGRAGLWVAEGDRRSLRWQSPQRLGDAAADVTPTLFARSVPNGAPYVTVAWVAEEADGSRSLQRAWRQPDGSWRLQEVARGEGLREPRFAAWMSIDGRSTNPEVALAWVETGAEGPRACWSWTLPGRPPDRACHEPVLDAPYPVALAQRAEAVVVALLTPQGPRLGAADAFGTPDGDLAAPDGPIPPDLGWLSLLPAPARATVTPGGDPLGFVVLFADTAHPFLYAWDVPAPDLSRSILDFGALHVLPLSEPARGLVALERADPVSGAFSAYFAYYGEESERIVLGAYRWGWWFTASGGLPGRAPLGLVSLGQPPFDEALRARLPGTYPVPMLLWQRPDGTWTGYTHP